MKVTLKQFSAAAPLRERYQEGVDYLSQEFDLELNDAVYLMGELKNHRSSLSVQGGNNSAEFYVESDSSLRVEIYGDDGFWSDTEVDFEKASEILRMVHTGESFGNLIPTTQREWDAYVRV
ncbi:MAG TPA: hypothetical protein VGQ39_24515 [Pyrinomonadaceae bacterium]|jgi:hypothetical protein|nr:hypothetical protein [Pyrinomonadaceae bacterium]